MKETLPSPQRFEFWFPHLDTHIRVEEQDDEVIIRASRNTFSERRKTLFIRELAAEGFIPENYQWFSDFHSATWMRVRWLVDMSWLKPTPIQVAKARRFKLRVFLYSSLLWLSLMTWVTHGWLPAHSVKSSGNSARTALYHR